MINMVMKAIAVKMLMRVTVRKMKGGAIKMLRMKTTVIITKTIKTAVFPRPCSHITFRRAAGSCSQIFIVSLLLLLAKLFSGSL